jgi:hypothetical protein
MRHIGVALSVNGRTVGQMRALCGAVCSTTSTGGEMCPVCEAIDKREKGTT